MGTAVVVLFPDYLFGCEQLLPVVVRDLEPELVLHGHDDLQVQVQSLFKERTSRDVFLSSYNRQMRHANKTSQDFIQNKIWEKIQNQLARFKGQVRYR